MANLIERTARSAFTLGGVHVRKGARVKLTRPQMKSAVAAGTVHSGEEDDAAEPVISTRVDHDALDAAAGNAAHNGTGEVQQLGDAESARLATEAAEAERRRVDDLARQAEVDAAARREAGLEADKARAAAEADKARAAAPDAAGAAGTVDATGKAGATSMTGTTGPTGTTGTAKSNVPPVPPKPAA